MARDAKISKQIRTLLAKVAADKYQKTGDDGQKTQLCYAEVIANQVVELAADKKEWAITFIAEYTEGKPTTAEKVEGGDSTTEERLRDVTRHHLNALESQFRAPEAGADNAAKGSAREPPQSAGDASKLATGLAARILALPKNRPVSAKDKGREPEIPAAPAG